jgi:hypothetical protein
MDGICGAYGGNRKRLKKEDHFGSMSQMGKDNTEIELQNGFN